MLKISSARKELLKENSLFLILRILFFNFLKIKNIVRIKIFSEYLYVRTSTPDISVACSNLQSEFKSLEFAYPKNYRGLIIDAGGYIGSAAIAFAKMYPNSIVVSIEPSIENFNLIKKNTKKFKNIHVYHAALMPNGSDEFVTLKGMNGDPWGYHIQRQIDDFETGENVPVISINNILKIFDFDSSMILKMDIEGSEYNLFLESDWLNVTKILAVELHERFVKGCENAFWDANKDRYIYKDKGEKFITIGKSYFI